MSFCRFCETLLPLEALICPSCQQPVNVTPLSTLTSMPVRLPESDAPYAIIIPTPQDVVLHENHQTWYQFVHHFQAQLDKHYCLALEEHLGIKKQDTGWSARAMIIFLILAGLAFLANLGLILLYSKPGHRVDALGLVSASMVVVGGFYLAYDLLGEKHGVLTHLTTYVTYALLGTIGGSMASILLLFQNFAIIPLNVRLSNINSDPTAGLGSSNALALTLFTRIALLCLFWGALMGVAGCLLARTGRKAGNSAAKAGHRPHPTWFKRLREALLCFGIWVLFISTLILVFFSFIQAKMSFILVLLRYEFLLAIFLTSISIGLVRIYRHYIGKKLAHRKDNDPWLYWPIFFVCTMLLFCLPAIPVFLLFLLSPVTVTAQVSSIGSIDIALGFALAGTLPTAFAPFTVKLFEQLDKYILGYIGLALASIGTILAIGPTLLDLIAK